MLCTTPACFSILSTMVPTLVEIPNFLMYLYKMYSVYTAPRRELYMGPLPKARCIFPWYMYGFVIQINLIKLQDM